MREQAHSEVTLQQLDTGGIPPPRKKMYRQLEQRVERIKEKMSAGQMSISEYLDAIGHLIRLLLQTLIVRAIVPIHVPICVPLFKI